MLYKITDKNGKPLGVHDSEPGNIWSYLTNLPYQGAPYGAEEVRELFGEKAKRFSARSPFVTGLCIGAPVGFGLGFGIDYALRFLF